MREIFHKYADNAPYKQGFLKGLRVALILLYGSKTGLADAVQNPEINPKH